MARMTDTRAGYAALMGAPVTIARVGLTTKVSDIAEGGSSSVLGVVWSPAAHTALTTAAGYFREALSMTKAAQRESVFVLAEGGRVLRAEINVSTLMGYGVPMFGDAGVRHDLTDAEILEAHDGALVALEDDLLFAVAS